MQTSSLASSSLWLNSIRFYVLLVTLLNGVWETLQMPLYTLWQDGSAGEIVFALAHCTLGDAMIASLSLLLALSCFGNGAWPQKRFRAVAISAIFIGVCYTIYSEWHNTTVSKSWAYTASMPSVLGIGLAPIAQWLIVPSAALWWTRFRYARLPTPDA